MEYAIRVELHGSPSRETYETLHNVMKKLGFNQTVPGTDSNGKAVRADLPHAVYYGSSQHVVTVVRDNVVKAVKTYVQQNIIVFAVQVANWAIG